MRKAVVISVLSLVLMLALAVPALAAPSLSLRMGYQPGLELELSLSEYVGFVAVAGARPVVPGDFGSLEVASICIGMRRHFSAIGSSSLQMYLSAYLGLRDYVIQETASGKALEFGASSAISLGLEMELFNGFRIAAEGGVTFFVLDDEYPKTGLLFAVSAGFRL